MLLGAFYTTANAQTTTIPTTQPYGKVDKADLEMKACDFEPDASAEVLFDKGNAYYTGYTGPYVLGLTVTDEMHRRIKIFNDNGKSAANVRLVYTSYNNAEYINDIQAQTINLVNGKIEITKLDKQQIYKKTIDKLESEIVFTLPNVKPGSIIEYKFNLNINNFSYLPSWDFQGGLPHRYSEYTTAVPDYMDFRPLPHLNQPLIKNIRSSENYNGYEIETVTRAMTNIPSIPDEPYMSSFRDNVQNISFQLMAIKPRGNRTIPGTNTWSKVGGALADDDSFGGQLRSKLNNEEAIINKAKTLKTDDEKIAYVFNEVKNAMKWNGLNTWYTIDGTSKAWNNKSGNSAEINIILYHLLKECNIEAYPMIVSTREHGKVMLYFTSLTQFNKAVVYVPVDSTKNYVLDATGKNNLYNVTPAELLNSPGFCVDKKKNLFELIYLKNDVPATQLVSVSGEISPNGKLKGTVEINSESYNKINAIDKYKAIGEKKYIESLKDNNNELNISSIKLENMDVDSLPLTQKAEFELGLTGSDENYIYLNPNLFTPLKINPFLNEKRSTGIDFEYLRNFYLTGVYKTPAGYKIDALPKTMTLVMPDQSMSFKRLVVEQEGSIIIRYSINYYKVQYSKDDYPDIHEFFKKMYEMLNEQIVLKKG